MKFYDFGRTPIICPGCQAEFDPESLVRSRRGRATAKPAAKSAKAAPDAGVMRMRQKLKSTRSKTKLLPRAVTRLLAKLMTITKRRISMSAMMTAPA